MERKVGVKVMINRDSHIPFYIQVANDIESKIKLGEYKPGDKIRTVNQLVNDYNVSRVTIVRALESLVVRNIIISRHGKGSYVKIHKHTEDLNKLRSFQEINEIEEEDVTQDIISFQIIKKPLHVQVVFDEGGHVLEIKRIHLKDGIPLAYVVIYLPEHIGDKISKDEVKKSSLYEVLGSHYVNITKAVQKIEASPAVPEVAEKLQIKNNSPILYVERRSLDDNNQNIMYSQFYYRHDVYSFIAHMYR